MQKEKEYSYWKMDYAIQLAQEAFHKGEVPVAALLLSSEHVIVAQAINQVEKYQDPCAHAEMLALRAAFQKTGQKRLIGYTLVVTLEPCPMCAAAAMHARVERIVFGAYDPKGGGTEHGARIFSHKQTLYSPEIIGGIQESRCQKLLRDFFLTLR